MKYVRWPNSSTLGTGVVLWYVALRISFAFAALPRLPQLSVKGRGQSQFMLQGRIRSLLTGGHDLQVGPEADQRLGSRRCPHRRRQGRGGVQTLGQVLVVVGPRRKDRGSAGRTGDQATHLRD